jgi:hypothetical protein
MITSNADRVHVPDQISGLLEAIQPNFSVVLPQLLELLFGFGEQRALRSDHRQSALNLRAVLDTTRIHTHQVESLDEARREERLGIGNVLCGAVPRPSRVEEERSDAARRILDRPPSDYQRNRGSRRPRPIERYLQRAALSLW